MALLSKIAFILSLFLKSFPVASEITFYVCSDSRPAIVPGARNLLSQEISQQVDKTGCNLQYKLSKKLKQLEQKWLYLLQF